MCLSLQVKFYIFLLMMELSRPTVLALVFLVLGTGCPQTTLTPPDDEQLAPAWSPAESEATYASECAACHGEVGEGGLGPALDDWTRGEDALTGVISETMPSADPTRCEGPCARGIARYILENFEASRCAEGETALAPRRLRLLNRREYDATLRDLFAPYVGEASGQACADVSACELGRERCASGVCEAIPCSTYVFALDLGDRRPGSVHVAGEFNGWAAAPDQGLMMGYLPSRNLWYAEADLGEGDFLYKYVIDGSEWIQDPVNPDSADDGFGGRNSIARVSCSGGGGGGGPLANPWSSGLPVEPRGERFGFDNGAEQLFVSGVHLDVYLGAARTLGALARERVVEVAGCDGSGDASTCAGAFVDAFGPRAFRRPLTAAERTRYVAQVMAQDDFGDGVEAAARTMLASPHFLYRSEVGELDARGGFTLTGWEMASALSYTFWGTMPDAELLRAAGAGELDSPAGIEAQATRLLDDPRSGDVLGVFAEQWLGIEVLDGKPKNNAMFPGWSDALGDSMRASTRAFFVELARSETASFEELYTAEHTFVDDRLAAHYGLPAPGGFGMTRVTAPAERRAGLLGHASIHAAHAHSDQTSPVKRGMFVRANLLCQTFPPPPANAGGVPEVDPNATTRERFAQHSADPACNSCHTYIDPVGFGFERFDAVGAWREREAAGPIDASGALDDVEGIGSGTEAAFTTLPELGQALAGADSARECLARQTYRFGFGYAEGPDERCTIEALARNVEGPGAIRKLLIALPSSPAFRQRRP